MRHLALGLLMPIVYFALRFALRVSSDINDEYTATTLLSHLKDFVQIMAYTWVPVDYMSIVYAPTRNWPLAAFTLLLALPFLWLLLAGWCRPLKSRTLLVLICCFLILMSPHLVTLASIMHNYAALSMAALIVAVLASLWRSRRSLAVCFSLFILAAIITDIHHTTAAIHSGALGRKLAMQAIAQTNAPAQKPTASPSTIPTHPNTLRLPCAPSMLLHGDCQYATTPTMPGLPWSPTPLSTLPPPASPPSQPSPTMPCRQATTASSSSATSTLKWWRCQGKLFNPTAFL